jgi:hypothetical protein
MVRLQELDSTVIKQVWYRDEAWNAAESVIGICAAAPARAARTRHLFSMKPTGEPAGLKWWICS